MIKPEEINPVQLGLISLGSLCGMAIGLLLSFIFTSTFWKLILVFFLLGMGLSGILKNTAALK